MTSGSKRHSFFFATIVISTVFPLVTGFDDSDMKNTRYTIPPPIRSTPIPIRRKYLFMLFHYFDKRAGFTFTVINPAPSPRGVTPPGEGFYSSFLPPARP